jgi:hypothetical protein
MSSILLHVSYSCCRTLAKTIGTYNEEYIVAFPQLDGSKFSAILDEEMGFM